MVGTSPLPSKNPRVPFRHAETIRAHCREDSSGSKYLITYDYFAGLDDRYTVICYSHQDAEVIGRELTLHHAKSLVKQKVKETMKDFG
jgi:hypothetical protein